MKRERIRVNETIATIIAEEEFISSAVRSVEEARVDLQDYIAIDPDFKTSFVPIDVRKSAPRIVQEMAEAANIAGVGPMASVAGAIAAYVVKDLISLGADHIIFDNGGDIAMYLKEPTVIGIYAGPDALSGLGFRISSFGEIIGLCTSSGSVGHSFSYGVADAACVFANNPMLADAHATKLGNLIRSRNPDLLTSALRETMNEHIHGCMVIIGHALGTLGQMPEIVRAKVDYELISKTWEVVP